MRHTIHEINQPSRCYTDCEKIACRNAPILPFFTITYNPATREEKYHLVLFAAVVDESTDLFAEVFAMDDHIDEAVLE